MQRMNMLQLHRDSNGEWTYDNLYQWEGHTGKVWDMRFSFDGARLATTGGDKTVRIWGRSPGRIF